MTDGDRPRGFTVSADQEGRRLDRVLRGLYKSVPLGAVMKSIRTGAVRVDDRKLSADARLVRGQRVTVPWDDDVAPGITRAVSAPAPPIDVIYRDEHIFIANKPAGLLSQPDERGGDSAIGRIVSALKWGRTDFRPALIGRLDRNVSGIIAAALSFDAARRLSEMMRASRIRKIYRAIVEGRAPESGEIDFPLLKDARDNIVRSATDGQSALTRFRTVRRADRCSLVELELVTGRPHQARAHMSMIGCPIMGDAKYGSKTKNGGRICLHALSLGFPDDDSLPPGIAGASYSAPYPRDFQRICDRMFV